MTARRVLRLEVPIDTEEEMAALEGALLGARATERSRARRRSDRLSFGYGSESARDTMNDEVEQAELRVLLLERLVAALKEASARDGT